jgi:AbrB family looped-hinge helix DNA binding protein
VGAALDAVGLGIDGEGAAAVVGAADVLVAAIVGETAGTATGVGLATVAPVAGGAGLEAGTGGVALGTAVGRGVGVGAAQPITSSAATTAAKSLVARTRRPYRWLLSSATRMLSMVSVKVSRKNQIAVPASVRRQLGIKPGDRLEVEVEDSKVVLRRASARSAVDELVSLAPEIWRGVDTDRYIDELRSEWTHREL